MKTNFDHIISLGYNCEVSFRIEDYTGEPIESYPFSWAYVTHQEDIAHILDATLCGELTEGTYHVNQANMFLFEAVGCAFHSIAEDKKQLLREDGSTNYEKADIYKEEIDSRVKHLQEKFKTLLLSSESVLYILKLAPCKEKAAYEEIIKAVASFLDQSGGNWHLTVVIQKSDLSEGPLICNNRNVSIHPISCYADDSNTKEGGDRAEWMRIIDYCNKEYGRPILCDEDSQIIPQNRGDLAKRYIEILDKQKHQEIDQSGKIQRLQNELEGLKQANLELQNSMEDIRNSKTWRVGRALLYIPGRIIKIIREAKADYTRR